MDKEFTIENTQWTQAKDQVSGDMALSAEGARLQIVSIDIDDRAETVYNFEVEEYHTYFVGEVGVWVHNDDYANKHSAEKVLEELKLSYDPRVDYVNNIRDDFGDSIKEGISAGLKLIKKVPGLDRVADGIWAWQEGNKLFDEIQTY